MQDFKKLFLLLYPYKAKVMISTISHLLMALFTIISIPLIIPFFHFLFSTRPSQHNKPDSVFDIIEWLQYYFLQMINHYGQEKTLMITCGFILLTIFLKNFFRYLALYIMVPVRSNVARDLRNQLYSSFIALSFNQEKEQKRGDLITRISNDVQEIEWNMLKYIDTLIKSPIIIIGAVLLMLSISAKLSLFVVVLMIFTAVVIGTLSKSLKRQSSQLQEQLSDINSHISESLDGSLQLKVYRVINHWKSVFQGINQAYKLKFDRVTRRQELSSPLSEFLGIAVVVALLWYGAKLVMLNDLEAETFFAFVLAFYHVIEPLKSFSSAYYYLKRGSASLQRIEESIMFESSEVDNRGTRSFQFDSTIKFENISYAYDQEDVLHNLDLKIVKGQKVALVGASGSGKSTLIRLLLKLISPKTGSLKIDDVDIEEISREDLYKNVGYVSQNSFLYNDSIRNNITLGRSDISDEKIMNCLELACALDFINELDNGLDTIVGERGQLLSGGEKQRITIARALIDDPELLILDEPTSALDPESDKAVSRAIINVLKDRTAIIIAHRISTIKFVNNIFVIDNGRVVEQGSHETLISKDGKYSRYVNIQSIE